jgi:hypothetical protein
MDAKISKIKDCSVEYCSYNKEQKCHAIAVTIGGPEPLCDTYADLEEKGGAADMAEVGACKVTRCAFNKSLECAKNEIDVGMYDNRVECISFRDRS